MNGKRANLAPLQVRETIGGIEQEAAGVRIQRDGDRVHGEITAAKIFHDGGKSNFRLVARMRVDVFPSGGQTHVYITRKDHFDVPQVFILADNLRPALLEFPSDPRGITLDSEIKIADRHSRSQGADAAADKI